MRIVTAGSRYMDIDAYAGAIAYAELLQARGEQAQAVSTAVWNESISQTVRSWRAPLNTTYTPNDTDMFTLIDISDPEHFDRFVDLARVDEVIDHHPGFEQYWQERIGDKAHIEFIGAACTLVYERWVAAGLADTMSETSAKLLVSGILDNTLNFKAHVTTERDRTAYRALVAHADIPDGWTAQYFTECQEAILADATTSIRNDSKILTFKTFPRPLGVGQLVVWDAAEVVSRHQATIEQELAAMKPEWFVNVVSVNEGSSYFVCQDPAVQAWVSDLLGVKFEGDVARADRMWLRKEIIKQDLE
ncbi:MAG TPA: DHH family phosphoesterase [Candidatus Saccharimonadia bacterium]|nr:DHH family phosphoesterase [Candidatus Saccharimonadia bacterium]